MYTAQCLRAFQRFLSKRTYKKENLLAKKEEKEIFNKNIKIVD
jgi:hypothetical protein